MISNIEHAADHINMLTMGMSQKAVYTSFGISYSTQRAILDGDIRRCKLKAMEKIAKALDMSIAELLINVDDVEVYGAEYAGAKVRYLPHNLKMMMMENGYSLKVLAREIDSSKRQLQAYRNGEFLPSLGRLQDIADALEVEVADFFLPVEMEVVK